MEDLHFVKLVLIEFLVDLVQDLLNYDAAGGTLPRIQRLQLLLIASKPKVVLTDLHFVDWCDHFLLVAGWMVFFEDLFQLLSHFSDAKE